LKADQPKSCSKNGQLFFGINGFCALLRTRETHRFAGNVNVTDYSSGAMSACHKAFATHSTS